MRLSSKRLDRHQREFVNLLDQSQTDMTPWNFRKVKNCLQLDGKKFATNEEIIAVIGELLLT
jgi:hypothetical protein